MLKLISKIVLSLTLASIGFSGPVLGQKQKALASNASITGSEEIRHFFEEAFNAGKDTGYAKKNKIGANDPHFGWTLGKFSISGFTRITEDDEKVPVFLKTVGDKVALRFILEQYLGQLNNDDRLSISEDTNGYNEYFGVEKGNFKHGALIIRQYDHQNNRGEPEVYTDFLSAFNTEADTVVKLFEEGDYEVALNYEIKYSPRKVLGKNILPVFSNYSIPFRFKIRNGNAMVFLYDMVTKQELENRAFTEHGFYLDLAESKYLNIDITKEVLNEGDQGLTEDIRFNRPAKDGEKFTEEGIYKIRVSNQYTEQVTLKEIYVGSDPLLKAYITTGQTLDEINRQLGEGAEISDKGFIIPVVSSVPASTPTSTKNPDTQLNTSPGSNVTPVPEVKGEGSNFPSGYLGLGVLIVGIFGMFIRGGGEKK